MATKKTTDEKPSVVHVAASEKDADQRGEALLADGYELFDMSGPFIRYRLKS